MKYRLNGLAGGKLPVFKKVYIPKMEYQSKEIHYIETEFIKSLYNKCIEKMEKNSLTTYDLQKKEGVCVQLLGVPYSTFNRLRIVNENEFASISEKQLSKIAGALGYIIQRTLIKKV